VLLHGCTIGDGTLVGNRATVLDGARIGAGSLIGAGTLVTPRTEIPPGSVVFGSPGKVVREVRPSDLEWIVKGNEAYRVKSRDYAAKLRPA
jgi:carbonic anhydrase/acetyltransferase-like protein (isoleucine patch superfamily)